MRYFICDGTDTYFDGTVWCTFFFLIFKRDITLTLTIHKESRLLDF